MSLDGNQRSVTTDRLRTSPPLVTRAPFDHTHEQVDFAGRDLQDLQEAPADVDQEARDGPITVVLLGPFHDPLDLAQAETCAATLR